MNREDAFGSVIQGVLFELYRDNIEGALEMLKRASALDRDPRYDAQAARIQSWMSHLQDRAAYVRAYEDYYRRVKRKTGLKFLELEIRMLLGKKTRKMVGRYAKHPEFQLLEREVQASRAERVLDAGSGEGKMALTLGARHPEVHVDGVEVSRTNVRIANKLKRYANVAFHEGLLEEMDRWFKVGSFDLAYCFAVLEHVRDVGEAVAAVLKILRPNGRFCFVVPMNGLKAVGPIPDFVPPEGVLGHVRLFTEEKLREKFGRYPGFLLHKVPGEWRPTRYPACFVPVEFGSFFVAFSKP